MRLWRRWRWRDGHIRRLDGLAGVGGLRRVGWRKPADGETLPLGGCETSIALQPRQAALDISPELLNFLGGRGVGRHFADRSSIHHRGGKINAMMDRNGCHRAMLRQRHSRFASDACTQRRRIDDEQHRFAVTVGDIHRGADGAQIVRTRTCREDHKIGVADHVRD